MTIDVKGAQSSAREPVPSGTWGNVSQKAAKLLTADVVQLTQNKIAAICMVPAYSTITGLKHWNDDLGSSAVLTFGYHTVSDGTSSDAAFATVADASGAVLGESVFKPFETTEDTYITVKQTGSMTPSAAKEIGVIVDYIYHGYA